MTLIIMTSQCRILVISTFIQSIYIYILTSPEVAILTSFQTAIQRPEFTSKIGLIVIDKCHLVEQWKDFRNEYGKLEQLRRLLRQDVL